MNSYKLISSNAAKTLNLGDTYGIKEGNPASFIILKAQNFYDALNQKSEVLYSFKDGRMISKTTPAQKEVLF